MKKDRKSPYVRFDLLKNDEPAGRFICNRPEKIAEALSYLGITFNYATINMPKEEEGEQILFLTYQATVSLAYVFNKDAMTFEKRIEPPFKWSTEKEFAEKFQQLLYDIFFPFMYEAEAGHSSIVHVCKKYKGWFQVTMALILAVEDVNVARDMLHAISEQGFIVEESHYSAIGWYEG